MNLCNIEDTFTNYKNAALVINYLKEYSDDICLKRYFSKSNKQKYNAFQEKFSLYFFDGGCKII